MIKMLIYFITISYFIFLVFISYYFLKNILVKKDMLKNYCMNYPLPEGSKSDIFKSLNIFFAKIGRSGKRVLPKTYMTRLENLISDNNEFKSSHLTVESFIGFKFFFSILLFIFCIVLIDNRFFMIIFSTAGLICGFFIPDYLIRYINLKRLHKMDKDLPYIIDLLYVTALSGQNIYNSIKIVMQKYDSMISNEFKVFLQQIDFGIGKKEAYKNIIRKNNSDSFKSFIFTLQQAENYGSSISELLRQKAEFLRFEINQEIDRKTRLISTKMLFPLIFLILPAFLLLVCGPLVYLMGGSMFFKI